MSRFAQATVCAVFGGLLLSAAVGYADDATKCEATKLNVASKYGACRLKAESKAVKKGGMPDFTKCNVKYGLKWLSAETKGGGLCPSNGDAAAIQAFITQHTEDVAAALAGGPLPVCSVDLAICNSDLTTAQSDLSTCNSNFASCSAQLATVNAGTAAQTDVLSGRTFSSNFGLGLTGTMPNVGQQILVPGTSAVTITQGYHDGTGFVPAEADLVAANVKNGVQIFGVTGTLQPPPLRTGQTTSYGAGSDGNLQKGASLSYTDNGDGTITDDTTGLMWEKKSRDGTIHDMNNTYTWGSAAPPYSIGSGSLVAVFLSALNGGGGFAGHTDWRIPNLNELQSLVNYENVAPTVSSAFNTGCVGACTVTTCSCTQSSNAVATAAYYWSSTTYQLSPDGAWLVYFYDAGLTVFSKASSHYVRAVRGGS